MVKKILGGKPGGADGMNPAEDGMNPAEVGMNQAEDCRGGMTSVRLQRPRRAFFLQKYGKWGDAQ